MYQYLLGRKQGLFFNDALDLTQVVLKQLRVHREVHHLLFLASLGCSCWWSCWWLGEAYVAMLDVSTEKNLSFIFSASVVPINISYFLIFLPGLLHNAFDVAFTVYNVDD